MFVSVNKCAKKRDVPALSADGTVFCGILGEGFDKLVDRGEMGDVVFLMALSKASNRLRMSGRYEFASDADVLILELEMAPCLLYSRAMLARTRSRE